MEIRSTEQLHTWILFIEMGFCPYGLLRPDVAVLELETLLKPTIEPNRVQRARHSLVHLSEELHMA